MFVHLRWSKMILIKELCSAQEKQVIGLKPESFKMTRRDDLSPNSPHPDLQQSKEWNESTLWIILAQDFNPIHRSYKVLQLE